MSRGNIGQNLPKSMAEPASRNDGPDGGCLSTGSRNASPGFSRSKDDADSISAPATPNFDPGSVPDYYEGDEYFFGYPRRGRAVIINNIEFQYMVDANGRRLRKKVMNDRPESEIDGKNLAEIFKDKFHFETIVVENCTSSDILSILGQEAARDHSLEDCFACAVLTHGGEEHSADMSRKEDILFGTDGEGVTVKEVLDLFSDEKCPSLTHKPRLFFIQACRGEKTDDGQEVDVFEIREAEATGRGDTGAEDSTDEGIADTQDEPSIGVSVTIGRDFLLAYATPPGYYAFRRRDTGSWFVSSLYDTVNQMEGEDLPLMEVLTGAARKQGLDFKSSAKKSEYNAKKVVPHFTWTLTKEVVFRPKTGPVPPQ